MQKSLKNFEAIVLKKINYKDTDRIYTLLSKERGKISVLAKGVRRINSKRSGSLDTMNQVVVGIAENSAGFMTLTEVKSINSFKNVKEDLDRSLAGYYMLELVNESVEEESEGYEVFELLKTMLEKLNDPEMKIGFVIGKFEFMLMRILGYELSLEKLRSFGKEHMNERLKAYVKEVLDTDFKSLEI